MDEGIEVLESTLHTAQDGTQTVTVERWPRKTIISGNVVRGSDLITRDGDVLTISVSNGARSYRVVEERKPFDDLILELMEA